MQIITGDTDDGTQITFGPNGLNNGDVTFSFNADDGTVSNNGLTLTTDEATYTFNPTTGEVTTVPVDAEQGVTETVGYTLTDSAGLSGEADLTTNIAAVAPPPPENEAPNPDDEVFVATSGGFECYAIDVIAGDTDDGTQISLADLASGEIEFEFVAGTGETVSNDGQTLTTDKGQYDFNPDTGKVLFTPNDANQNAAITETIEYKLTDSDGDSGTATVSVDIPEYHVPEPYCPIPTHPPVCDVMCPPHWGYWGVSYPAPIPHVTVTYGGQAGCFVM